MAACFVQQALGTNDHVFDGARKCRVHGAAPAQGRSDEGAPVVGEVLLILRSLVAVDFSARVALRTHLRLVADWSEIVRPCTAAGVPSYTCYGGIRLTASVPGHVFLFVSFC